MIIRGGNIILRNWFWTRTLAFEDIESVGLEGRVYLGAGELIVFRTHRGKRRACIGLNGRGTRTVEKIDEIAELLGVPRRDER